MAFKVERSSSSSQLTLSEAAPVLTYFLEFIDLTRTNNWARIIILGEAALKEVKNNSEKALIHAQLTSTYFYQGKYVEALSHAQKCRELSSNLDSSLLLRSLYLESACHRALAAKEPTRDLQQAKYKLAVETAEQAAQLYLDNDFDDSNLFAKIHFNLGAAHADNPEGNLVKAKENYQRALIRFHIAEADDDLIRTKIRLGKVALLQKDYKSAHQMINDTRTQTTNERILMQIDYLEAQLLLAESSLAAAMPTIRNGLTRAQNLGAQEDLIRFEALLRQL